MKVNSKNLSLYLGGSYLLIFYAAFISEGALDLKTILKVIITLTLFLLASFWKLEEVKKYYKLVLIAALCLAVSEFSFMGLVDDKSLGYLIFLLTITLVLIKNYRPDQYRFVLYIMVVVMYFIGARGVLVAVLIGLICSTKNIVKFSSIIVLTFIVSYTTFDVLYNYIGFDDSMIGKSELDRSLMNILFLENILTNPIAPFPTLIQNTNIMGDENTEGVYVHNYWLVAWSYLGLIAPIFLYSILVKAKSCLLCHKELLFAVVVLITLSPETNISRFLVLSIPGLLLSGRQARESSIAMPSCVKT